jgi:translation initiation factor 3 subunit D
MSSLGRSRDRPFASQRWGWNEGRIVSSQVRATSIEIKTHWKVRDQYEFGMLTKMITDIPPEPVDLAICGTLMPIDPKFERFSVRIDTPLERFARSFYSIVSTAEDPVIRELSSAEPMVPGKYTVFTTDSILAALMASPRSVYPWDITVIRTGGRTFLDKRPNCSLDEVTVNETASQPPVDDKEAVNTPQALAQEAAYVNQMYSQQLLAASGAPKKFPRPFPFVEEKAGSSATTPMEPPAPTAFRYRRWTLGEKLSLVARTELHGYRANAADQYMSIFALNEWDLRDTNWRNTLETQRGGVLANELKNNSYKLARWTLQALLSGSQEINLGFVSRRAPKDSFNHAVLGSMLYQTKNFALQINVNLKNAWGILRKVLDSCNSLPDGRYVIAKDPVKSLLRIYDTAEETSAATATATAGPIPAPASAPVETVPL